MIRSLFTQLPRLLHPYQVRFRGRKMYRVRQAGPPLRQICAMSLLHYLGRKLTMTQRMRLTRIQSIATYGARALILVILVP